MSLTEKIFCLKPKFDLFDSVVISNILPEKKAGAIKLLLKRAIDKGEILRLKPGLYCLSETYRCESPHPFVVAQAIFRPSYVSLETALRYHGLIPEITYQVASVINKRSRRFDTPLGRFTYDRVPSHPLMAGVTSVKVGDDSWAFVATPLRAIADLVYLRKVRWRRDGLKFLLESMRIEEDDLHDLDMGSMDEILSSLGSYRVREYIKKMAKEVA